MPHTFRAPTRATLVTAGVAIACLAVSGAAVATQSDAHPGAHRFTTKDDTASAGADGTVTGNVLANDKGATAVVRTGALSDPAAGAVDVAPNGDFTFTPATAGAHGTVTFTYGATDAVQVYRTDLPPLDSFGATDISGGSYGSAFTAAPGRKGFFYGITDRGPNADSLNGNKVEPMSGVDPAHPAFQPRIGLFRLKKGEATLVGDPIGLSDIHGTPYNGLPNTVTKKGIAASSETIEDMTGKVLPTDPNGYDPEGLVALKDGTFWVSDEYGPYVTHFNRTGREIERLSPWASGVAFHTDEANHRIDVDHPLPAELRYRTKNKGMEGLTVTPDGRTLVGIMQSALTEPDLGTAKTALIPVVRIVTVDLRTKAMHEYVYLLDDPAKHSGNAVSEITAISSTRFVVDERDGSTGAGTFKQLYLIDLDGATDVTGTTGDARGYLINGKSIDAYVGQADTATATKMLVAAGVTPVGKVPYLDMGGLVTQADPTGFFFGHDKIEGVATTDGGRTLYLANDSDFGLDHTNEAAGPYTLHQKTLPNGQVDDGEVLAVDTTRLPLVAHTATVTITY